MKQRLVFLMSVAFILAAEIAGVAGQFDNVLSVADVEKATGLSGVKQVPRNKAVDGITENKFLTGDINFVRADNQPILMVQFRPLFILEQLKSDAGYVKAQLQGLGEEAFTSPAFDPQTTVNFKKGNYVVVIATHIDPKDKTKTILKMDQVISLAKIVASRMP